MYRTSSSFRFTEFEYSVDLWIFAGKGGLRRVSDNLRAFTPARLVLPGQPPAWRRARGGRERNPRESIRLDAHRPRTSNRTTLRDSAAPRGANGVRSGP